MLDQHQDCLRNIALNLYGVLVINDKGSQSSHHQVEEHKSVNLACILLLFVDLAFYQTGVVFKDLWKLMVFQNAAPAHSCKHASLVKVQPTLI